MEQQHEYIDHRLGKTEHGEMPETEQPQSEAEAIPLGPETQAIIIQSIN